VRDIGVKSHASRATARKSRRGARSNDVRVLAASSLDREVPMVKFEFMEF
jgi:hypothetical protein